MLVSKNVSMRWKKGRPNATKTENQFAFDKHSLTQLKHLLVDIKLIGFSSFACCDLKLTSIQTVQVGFSLMNVMHFKVSHKLQKHIKSCSTLNCQGQQHLTGFLSTAALAKGSAFDQGSKAEAITPGFNLVLHVNVPTYVRMPVELTVLLDASSVLCRTVKNHKDAH